MSILSTVFFILLLLMVIIQIYLAFRQIKSLKKNQGVVPKRFLSMLTAEQHHKNSEYNIAKLDLSIIRSVANGLLILVMTFGSGINWFNIVFAHGVFGFTSPYLHDIAIIVVYMLFNNALSLVFSFYATFEIEEKYGFNKMTVKTFFGDLIKSTVVGCVIGIPLLLAALSLIYYMPDSWWLLVFILLLSFNLLMLILYPLVIAPLFNKFTPLKDESLYTALLDLIAKSGLYFKGIFVMDASKRSTHGNAYFTGIGKSKRIVFFDSLLAKLNQAEIVAVLAHELGHFKHKHIIKQMIISFIIMFLTLKLVNICFNNENIYHSLGVINVNVANGIFLTMIVLEVLSFFISPIFSLLSRHNEFEADAFAAKVSEKNDLMNGLVKLSCENASVLYPDRLYVAVYYSHPTLSERIEHLERQGFAE